MDALNLWLRFLWEEAVRSVRLSLCLQDLLQLLGLLTQLLGWGETLPHLGEERCHLVAAQKTRSPPFQSMQNTRLHCSWVQKQTHGWHKDNVDLSREYPAPTPFAWGYSCFLKFDFL